jgi:hypothetical protein
MFYVFLIATLHREWRVLRSLDRSRAGALTSNGVRALSDFFNRFPRRSLQHPRGKKPPAR